MKLIALRDLNSGKQRKKEYNSSIYFASYVFDGVISVSLVTKA